MNELRTALSAQELDAEILPFNYFPFGTHLSGSAWERYHLASLIRSAPKASDVYVVRELARLMNDERAAEARDVPPVSAGQLLTAGLLEDILRFIIDKYCWEEYPGTMDRARAALASEVGPDKLERRLQAFVGLFPATTVKQGEVPQETFLEETTSERPHRDLTVWETVLLRMCMQNRAMRQFRELFDDSDLERVANYTQFVNAVEKYFAKQPPVGVLGVNLFEALRAPMLASPDSLDGQLEYILSNWTTLLPPKLVERLLVTRGVLKEETQMRGHGPGPAAVLTFRHGAGMGGLGHDDYPEPERFTRDADWMTNVVLMAKSTYVWLDQLSKKYQRTIERLDQVPDEELQQMGRWGITGLWLIGIWERSTASADIKRIMGNPEALSSAYSLFDYRIADDLGGDWSYMNLRDRAARCGVRLASDMVPNHMGIFSKWVCEHPDWFVQLDYPPFPGYQFTGPNLSRDGRYTIQIEDGYWNHSDAAVVFRLIENETGKHRFIYHGNDGTSMPWNDTAQLNYMMPEVREAAIQTILDVARRFPIIRFDAAMTLAKRHYQRLWFPKPDEGGAIPSRAEQGLSKSDFDAAMPEEFWREVVDRIQAEAPDTLLLAEAFWLMEGYFVRTLGMHRVYNSAFMNMLKMEENAKYRATIKNVLEFSPEVLKRFVNFMSNPDEKTAVEQFGRGDKYYGVATLMVTMPGLPMLGHGQIEGYAEKYGMEYRRAYWDEQVDHHMIYRHEAEIFPLMRRRHLFSGVEHFAMYDFVTANGSVDENVFAYSNRDGNDRSLILYNNAFNDTSGTIRVSCAINRGTPEASFFVSPSLGEALAIRNEEDIYYIFRDHREGTEYIRQGAHFRRDGFTVSLRAYQYCAFIQFREVVDTDGLWGKLAYALEGRGVPSIDMAYRQMVLAPVLGPLREAISPALLKAACTYLRGKDKGGVARTLIDSTLHEFLRHCTHTCASQEHRDAIVTTILDELDAFSALSKTAAAANLEPCMLRFLNITLCPPESPALARWHVVAAWTLMRHLAPVATGDWHITDQKDWMDQWLFTSLVADAFVCLERDSFAASQDSLLVKFCFQHLDAIASVTEHQRADAWRSLVRDLSARGFLGINEHDGVTWISKEQLDTLIGHLYLFATAQTFLDPNRDEEDRRYTVGMCYERAIELIDIAEETGYQLDPLSQLVS